ncbi:MAG: hypothetical protein NTW59_00560 [Candidatus Diapherotrites archaeon]|nr:hypothetical protein [Candidatus Diapherotrites archaeon]
MELLQAVFLGILQGLTEWLPISSRSQVIAVGLNLFGMAAENASRSAVFLHIGTVIAAAAYFRKELWQTITMRDRETLRFIIAALVGTAITAAPLYIIFRKAYGDPFLVMLLIGGGLLFTGLIQFRRKAAKAKEKPGNGFFVGLGQGFSAIPGISRSGVTTSVLLFSGFTPEQAFRLSFILGVPSVFIAEIAFSLAEGPALEPNIWAAIATAAIVGYVSVGALLRIAKKIRFAWFCVAFGLLYLALAFI